MEANSYLCRFLDTHYIVPELLTYTGLDPKNMLIEALDFHCTNVCDILYNKANIGIDPEELKHLIWDHCSSVNTRVNISGLIFHKLPKTDKLWQIIEPIYKLCCQETKKNLYTCIL